MEKKQEMKVVVPTKEELTKFNEELKVLLEKHDMNIRAEAVVTSEGKLAGKASVYKLEPVEEPKKATPKKK